MVAVLARAHARGHITPSMRDHPMATEFEITEGTLPGGLPYLRFGSGPRLIVLRGFTTTHDNPTGLQRKVEVRMLAPLARHFDVYAVNRAPGLAPGATMADIATQHAEAFRAEFGEPVDLLGLSSGGSIALQIAADHPDVVHRLVLVGAAGRIGAEAAAAQMRYIDAVAAGKRGAQHLAAMKVSSPIGARILAPIMWLLDPLARPKDPSDMVAFARAEDAFDVMDRLDDISAPTLVVGGEHDNVYGLDLLRGTADGVRDGRLIVYPGASHASAMTDKRLGDDVATFLQAA
jgi:pimeloyl-ACP methyl ester carboxylesterase